LRQSCGADSRRWRWGSIHSLALKHPLGRSPLLHGIANLGPLPASGDGMTINAGHYRHSNPYEQIIGAALRMVIDTGCWEHSRFILPAGQSGHPLSPHYRDQLDLWLSGRGLRLGVDDDKFHSCLIITPC
jgi:penicillin amidase